MAYGQIGGGADQMRDAITQALLNVQNPPPRTQVPGGGVGAPAPPSTQPPGVQGMPGAPGATGLPGPGQAGGMPAPGVGGPVPPGIGGMNGPPPGVPTLPTQMMPTQPGGGPIPPQQNVPGIVGRQPPQAGQIPGTQLPLSRY